jgi:hypothetical protein
MSTHAGSAGPPHRRIRRVGNSIKTGAYAQASLSQRLRATPGILSLNKTRSRSSMLPARSGPSFDRSERHATTIASIAREPVFESWSDDLMNVVHELFDRFRWDLSVGHAWRLARRSGRGQPGMTRSGRLSETERYAQGWQAVQPPTRDT